jgi:RNA-binding protein
MILGIVNQFCCIKNMKSEKEHKKLSGKQLRYLRGLGHHLKPLVILGRDGITVNVIKAAKEVIEAHELVKFKIGNGCHLGRQEAAAALAEETGSEVIQVLGKTFLVFRENPERNDEHRIRLP